MPSNSPSSGASNLVVEPLPITDYYRLIRGQIEHEDNLMVQRLNWFITSQSFLFSAYAIDVTSLFANPPIFSNDLADRRQLLRIMIPFVAISASALIMVTIFAGVLAMHNLRMLYQKHLAKAAEFDLPPVMGYRRTWKMGLAAPLLLPLVFLAVWMFLLLHTAHPVHSPSGATSQQSNVPI